MLSYEEIYAKHAVEYDELVAHEDYQGNLIQALAGIVELKEKSVIEFGAGTGRLTMLLSPFVKEIHAFDQSPHMLARAEKNLTAAGYKNFTLRTGEHLRTGAPSSAYDIAIEGWGFGHCILAQPKAWRDVAKSLLDQMQRVVKINGTCVVIETLGTGFEEPQVPNNELGLFYSYLETTAGFRRMCVRTDYRFDRVENASRVLSFFFGERMRTYVEEKKCTIIPECTGIWYRTA